MQINNLLFNYIQQNIPRESLELNSIFEGEIVNIEGDSVYVNIPGSGLVKAQSEIDLGKLLGSTIKFIVNSKKDGLIEIKPMIDENGQPIEELESSSKDSVSKILKGFNIKEDEGTRKIVDNLMKHDIPLKREVIQEAIKTYDKLVELIELEDSEDVELIEPRASREAEMKNADISKEKLSEEPKENLVKERVSEPSGKILEDRLGKEISKLLDDTESDIGEEKGIKADIKNIVVQEKEIDSDSSLKKLVESSLKEFDMSLKDDEIVDIVGFLTKNKIKASLNNIKNLKEVLDDPFEFMEETKELMEKVKTEIKVRKEFKLDDNDEKQDIKNETKSIKEPGIEKKDMPSSEIKDKKDLVELKNKAEFIRDLNKDMLFHFVPINYGKESLDGLVNFLKEKEKKRAGSDKINIFISLETHNLGRVKISCQAMGEDLNVLIGVQEDDEPIFKASSPVLKERIEELGYSVQNIKFILNEEFNMSEEIISNTDPMHFLDIKV